MQPLPLAAAPNETVYKRITRKGHTDDDDAAVVAPSSAGSNCRLTVHYNGYFEGAEQPFDSTYRRGKPFVFVTGQWATLPGLEQACRSMRVGEEAQFIIPYALLYGELGCPPRIPARADALFIMQLLRRTDVGDEQGIERLTAAERVQYAVVMPQARNVYTKAVDAFKRADYATAGRLFHKAVAGLEACTLRDESEATEQQAFVLRLYTNLALVYNKLDRPKRACLMCNEIDRLLGPQRARQNCKALFQHGRALLRLGDFVRAEEKLRQAQRLQPTNADVTAELKLLAAKQLAYAENERLLCQRAFGMTKALATVDDATTTKQVEPATVSSTTTTTDAMDELDAAFRSMTVKCLEDFERNATVQTMHLPAGLSGTEVACVERLIAGMRMRLEVRDSSGTGDKSYVLRKTTD